VTDTDRPAGAWTWRYAVTRDRFRDEDVYTLREVYTHADGRLTWTESGMAPRGGSWAECAQDLLMMRQALYGMVLDLTVDPPKWVTPPELPGLSWHNVPQAPG
jgi:hypothetical protein